MLKKIKILLYFRAMYVGRIGMMREVTQVEDGEINKCFVWTPQRKRSAGRPKYRWLFIKLYLCGSLCGDMS
jgi:hypothetical protein